MNFEFFESETPRFTASRIIIVILGTIFMFLIVLFIVVGSKGEKLNHHLVDMYESSNLTTLKATCKSYDNTVISTKTMYDEFLSDCEMIDLFDYDSSFFLEEVIVVHFEYTENMKLPNVFYDSFFSENNKEIFKVSYKRLNPDKNLVYNLYLIEINKDDIGSFDVIIG